MYPAIQEILFVESRKCYIEHYYRTAQYNWNYSIYAERSPVISLRSIETVLSVADIYHKVYLILEEEV
ncbi:hypothetical protein KTT_51010 [Tengunoibacter tsumagoiensis]|uniref:Uncharacterized protein n=1 Tax=Tengunoibacter tsumagoiensis TaxID=2014871 RepID=A0A402A7V9_9CHLR|nr:hypothetical protein KTT_51010 [Tengunoibacter tsumagoiensis]